MIEKEDGNPGWSAQSYLKIVDDSLIVLGKKMIDEADSSQSQHGSNYYYPFPLEYGTKWQSVKYDTMGLWGVIENQKYYNEVDAYGTLKLPSGDYECLRLRTSVVQMDGSYMGLKYYFLSKDYIIMAIVTSQPNDTTYNFSNAVGVEYYTGFTGIGFPKPRTVHPEHFQLAQNYPNPFNSVTTITFDLPKVVYGELSIYNIAGQKIKTLRYGRFLSGRHQAIWDGTDFSGQQVASGTYICKFTSSEFEASERMLLLK